MYNLLFLIVFLVFQPQHNKTESNIPVSFDNFSKIFIKNLGALDILKSKAIKAKGLVKSSKALKYPSIEFTLLGAPSHKYVCTMPDAWNTPEARNGMSEDEFKKKFCVGTDIDDKFTLDLNGYVVRLETEVTQPIYTFGRISDYINSSKHLYRSSSFALKAGKQKALIIAAQIYYARKLAKETMKVLKKGEELLNIFEKKFERLDEQGKLKPSDRFRFKLGIIEIKRLLASSQKTLTQTKGFWEAYIGKGYDTDDIPLSSVSRNQLKSLDYFKRKLLNYNPELMALRESLVAAQFKLKGDKKAFYPEIGLYLRYRYTTSNSDDPQSAYLNDPLHGNSLSGALVLRMNLDFSKMNFTVSQSKSEVLKIKAKYLQTKQKLLSKLTSLYGEILDLLKQLALVNKALKVSRAWIGVIKEKDDTSISYDPKDAVSSVKAYFQYKLERLVLYYKLTIKRIELESLVGCFKNY